MGRYLAFFEEFTFSNFLDIAIVAVIIYVVYSQVARTPALPAIQGFFIIIFLTLLASMFNLTTLNYILENVVSIMLLSVIILFPSEIRQGLYRIRDTTVFQRFLTREHEYVARRTATLLASVVAQFKRQRLGVIIVLEKRDSLAAIINTGVMLNAEVNEALLYAIFQKASPLHDGAVVIRNNRLVSAACYVPNLSFALRTEMPAKERRRGAAGITRKGYAAAGGKRHIGTRHRAALSVAESSDAFVIVLSEETGQLSVAYQARLERGIAVKAVAAQILKYFHE